MNKHIPHVITNRWSKLEDRANEVNALMMELEELDKGNDDKPSTSTTVYRLLKQESTMIADEQQFLEKIQVLMR